MTYTYKLGNDCVLRSDGSVIPKDAGNADYAEYVKWVQKGGVPTPADVPVRNVQAEIDALEREQMLPRGTREALLALTLGIAATQGITEPQLYAANIAYKKIKDFNEQIALLREQL